LEKLTAMTIVELIAKPGGQYHFGSILPVDEDQNMTVVSSFPQSDVLFSAIINIWTKVYGNPDSIINRFKADEIKLSSAFFYLKEGNRSIRFLPKPIVANLARSDNHKKLKRIQFVSEELLANGILPDQWLNTGICTLIDNQFICLKSEVPSGVSSIYSEKLLTKVKVHTTEIEHRLYNQANVQFSMQENNIETGYYFFLDEKLPDDEKDKLYTVIRLIADEGLGGDRTAGCGLFEGVRMENISFPKTHDGYFFTLSLSNPSKNEKDAFLFQQIVTRGGKKFDSRTQLKYVNMIAEGAIIYNGPMRNLSGRIVDISPQNNGTFLRYGKFFLYPLHKNYTSLWEKEN
jgi:CRISPR-associated protein Csm4